jgi:hypothetical protein
MAESPLTDGQRFAGATATTSELVELAGIDPHLIVQSIEGAGPSLDLQIAHDRAYRVLASSNCALPPAPNKTAAARILNSSGPSQDRRLQVRRPPPA